MGALQVTMKDLALYCKFFPAEYQQQYTLRVVRLRGSSLRDMTAALQERILNSNGLSLQLGSHLQVRWRARVNRGRCASAES
jgi:hypothetical protein